MSVLDHFVVMALKGLSKKRIFNPFMHNAEKSSNIMHEKIKTESLRTEADAILNY